MVQKTFSTILEPKAVYANGGNLSKWKNKNQPPEKTWLFAVCNQISFIFDWQHEVIKSMIQSKHEFEFVCNKISRAVPLKMIEQLYN